MEYLLFLYWMLFMCEVVPFTHQADFWMPWSSCSKSCGIGVRSRISFPDDQEQSQYCNLQYCDNNIGFTCTGTRECDFPDGKGTCKNGRCKCSLGEHYNEHNCYPEFGKCIIRINSKTAIGYRDPSIKNDDGLGLQNLRSCTANDNKIFEVHVIGIKGDHMADTQEVHISARGPINKPIVLVLSSFEWTTWVIQTYVGLYNILYGGASTLSAVELQGCITAIPIQRLDYPYADGVDIGDGNTIKLLKMVSDEFGPITSFTGYENLRNKNTRSTTRIFLNVGGDPLSTASHTVTNNVSWHCQVVRPPIKYELQTVFPQHSTTESSGLAGNNQKQTSQPRSKVKTLELASQLDTRTSTMESRPGAPEGYPSMQEIRTNVLVLSSFERTTWVIQTYVGLYNILYGGASTLSAVELQGCITTIPIQRLDYPYADGVDIGDGNTIKLLKMVSDEFGPITSFTGYENLRDKNTWSTTRILLNVGGDPLSTVSHTVTNNVSWHCQVVRPPIKYELQTVFPQHSTTESSGLAGGGIAGIVVSVILFIALISICWLCCMSRVKSPSPSPPPPTQFRYHQQNRPEPRVNYSQSAYVRRNDDNARIERNGNIGRTLNNESERSGSSHHSELERHNQPLFLSIDQSSPPPAYDTLTPPTETPPPSYQVCLQAIETTVSLPETTTSVPETTSTIPEITSTIPETSSAIPETTSTIPETTSTIPETTSTYL